MEPAKKSNARKVMIVGAGPAGLTAAYVLSKAGVQSIVLEKDRLVGGISRTVNYKDYYFDIGGHRFFTKVKAVDDMWKELLGADLLRRKRLSRIYYNKKYFSYPLRPFNALFSLGIWNSFLVLLSFLYAQIFPWRNEETFEHWVVNRFGDRLYKTFFKTYTEKVWEMPCSEIRAEWAAQRIKGLSLLTGLRNALIRSKNNNKDIRTLIEEFDYPKFGPGMMWQTAANIVQQNGCQVWLGAEVAGILWSENRVTTLEVKRNGQVELIDGTDFVSSMPIREVIEKFKPPVPKAVLRAASDLKYRDFLTTVLIIDKREVFPDNWIYIHDPDVKVGRIQNFKNWSPFMVPDEGKTCLGLEYFCFEGDSFWTLPDNDLIELGKKELEVLGLVTTSEVQDGLVVRMPKAYPIYDSAYRESLSVVRTFLQDISNFQVVGRNGMHKYNNQDHSMLTAMLAAENILGSNHDLWKVNTEQDYHEEISAESGERAALKKAFAGLTHRIDQLGLATALGSVVGLLTFAATVWLIIRGGQDRGLGLDLLGQYFWGYSITVKGAFIGLAYSFFWGFLFGWLFAYLRNLLSALFLYLVKRKEELLTFKDFLDHF
ncbi:MAG: NAD(P)/FAD-dependent oxidoreductase [Syntrophobacteraceae bacterium]|jgi:protoporphyrinogen oxidase